MKRFFYDSYALIEYFNDNPRFASYFEGGVGILTLLNALEVYYHILANYGKEKADLVLDTLYELVSEPTKENIRNAMAFRLENKRRNLSYADALGYQVALDRGIPFLTGDNQFKGLKNVEFVK